MLSNTLCSFQCQHNQLTLCVGTSSVHYKNITKVFDRQVVLACPVKNGGEPGSFSHVTDVQGRMGVERT